MTHRFEIVEAKPWHCGIMARRLRGAHRDAILKVGGDIHRELRLRFDASSYRRAWLIDGELAVLGGVTGMMLSTSGYIWAAMTERATHFPLAFVKEAQRQIGILSVTRHELATTVIGGDEAAKRLAVFLGFHVADIGPGSQAFSRAGRRQLAQHIDSNPDIRLPVGNGYAVALGYHPEGGA